MIGFLIIDHRHCKPSETHINRSFIFISGFHSSSRFHVIGRIDDNHPRDCTHQRNIFVALVGRSVFAHRNTRMGSSDFHIQVRIADTVSDLFISASCREHGKTAGKRHLACRRKARRNTHHIGFCNTAVNMSVRKYLFKHICLCRACKISI